MNWNRIKIGMSFDECLITISERRLGTTILLTDICKTIVSISGNDRAHYGLLSRLDTMGLYGKELDTFYINVCGEDKIKFIIAFLALEVGLENDKYNKFVPEFARLTNLQIMIVNLGLGKEVAFPFDEAKKFIEENSPIIFPKVIIEPKLTFLDMVRDAWACITNPEARAISEFKYSNGRPMSVRCAKKEGLISEETEPVDEEEIRAKKKQSRINAVTIAMMIIGLLGLVIGAFFSKNFSHNSLKIYEMILVGILSLECIALAYIIKEYERNNWIFYFALIAILAINLMAVWQLFFL